MRDEQQETAAFERLVGGVDRAQQLLRIYTNSHPSGTKYDLLMHRGLTKEQVFAANAIGDGFKTNEIRAFLALQQ